MVNVTKRRWLQRGVGVAGALLIVLTGRAEAQCVGYRGPFDNEYAKIILHIVPAGSVRGSACRSSKAAPPCNEMKVAGDLNIPYFAFLCVTDGSAESGIAGLQCGIEYNGAGHLGVDIFEWQLCATLDFPSPSPPWPSSRSGNLVTWDLVNSCQRNEPSGAGTGVTAVAGYFYLTAYTADRLSVTVRPVDGSAKVADCTIGEQGTEAREDEVAGPCVHFARPHLGSVEFSEGARTPGYNPCGLAKPVVDATWSEVKSGNDR